jgi:hypothetical protein
MHSGNSVVERLPMITLARFTVAAALMFMALRAGAGTRILSWPVWKLLRSSKFRTRRRRAIPWTADVVRCAHPKACTGNQ